MSRPIVSVLGDAGGAEALGPVLASLARSRALGAVRAMPAAGPVLRRLGVDFEPIDPNGLGADGWLRSQQAGGLITTTSWGPGRIELEFLAAARRNGIPSLAIIDFWSNYRARFAVEGGDLVLPDRIAVPDEQAHRESVRDGLPETALVVTGNPHHESLLARYGEGSGAARTTVRERAGVDPAATLVLFASQPIAALYRDRIGYTESGVLALVAAALDDVSRWLGRPIVLAVRAHPRESGPVRPESTARVSVIDGSGDDPLDWCLASDLVVGMSSALLFDAALLGGRVVSVQPGLVGPDVLPSNRLGISVGVYLQADVAPALARALGTVELARPRALAELRAKAVGATARLVREIETLRTPLPSGVGS